MDCECIIGILNVNGSQQLVTAPMLFDHINHRMALCNQADKARVLSNGMVCVHAYTINDYCDGAIHTDLFRFTCCPICGSEINWKSVVDMYMSGCYNNRKQENGC